jgi:hypothetical protein
LNKKIFSFTLDPENVEKLKEYLLKEGLSLSDFIDGFIEDFVLNELPKIEKGVKNESRKPNFKK